MSAKQISPNMVKHELDTAILQAINNPYKEMGEDECKCVRKRTLTVEKMVKLLLSMQGGSIQKELYDAGVDVTASAFVQQRDKISWTIFEDVFNYFNFLHQDTSLFKGYRVLAVDGTTVNMAEILNQTVSFKILETRKDTTSCT